jgi:hypothetical protein
VTHFSVLVIGDVEEQLAIYDENLQVERYKEYLRPEDVEDICSTYDVDPGNYDEVIPLVEDWTGWPGGIDDKGLFFWSTSNPRARWDWWILGGRWTGYLKLRAPGLGELGKPGAGLKDQPLRYGDLSADCALFGDVDWEGMSIHHAQLAEAAWEEAMESEARGDPWRMIHGIEPGWGRDDFVHHRSHVATACLVKDSDWYERGRFGWWGTMLDPEPVAVWHAMFDHLLSGCRPETLVSVVDCHQ